LHRRPNYRSTGTEGRLKDSSTGSTNRRLVAGCGRPARVCVRAGDSGGGGTGKTRVQVSGIYVGRTSRKAESFSYELKLESVQDTAGVVSTL
jgi:hypothetical protein